MKIIDHAVLKLILHILVLQLFVPLTPWNWNSQAFGERIPQLGFIRQTSTLSITMFHLLNKVLASFHIDGEALVWCQDCEESGIFDWWETLVQALLLRFGTTSYDDPMEALTRLRQTLTRQFTRVSLRLRQIESKAYLHNTDWVVSWVTLKMKLDYQSECWTLQHWMKLLV